MGVIGVFPLVQVRVCDLHANSETRARTRNTMKVVHTCSQCGNSMNGRHKIAHLLLEGGDTLTVLHWRCCKFSLKHGRYPETSAVVNASVNAHPLDVTRLTKKALAGARRIATKMKNGTLKGPPPPISGMMGSAMEHPCGSW